MNNKYINYIRTLPEKLALIKAVSKVLDRCSRTYSNFTVKSVEECVLLDNPRWCFNKEHSNLIGYYINFLFTFHLLKAKVPTTKCNSCKGNCFCLNFETKLYSRKLIKDKDEEYYLYCLNK